MYKAIVIVAALSLSVAGRYEPVAEGAVGGAGPTFSVEVAEVNGVDVGPSPASTVTVRPGDTLTVEFFLRDWSPAGERLRGYQTEVDFDSYTNGGPGNIYPKDFSTTTDLNGKCTAGGPYGIENNGNVYIDSSLCFADSDPAGSDLGPWSDGGRSVLDDCLDPPLGTGLCTSPIIDWVFGGVPDTITVTNTMDCDYWHIAATMLADQGPICEQDGSKYYLGTLILDVSPDARGIFIVSLDENHCLAADENNDLIEPIFVESLRVRVREDPGPPRAE